MGAANLSGCIQDSEDCKAISAEDEAAKKEYWEIAKAALNPTEFRVVSMYFRESFTQEDIGERLGFSQQRVYQILEKALNKLRNKSVRKRLERAIPAAKRPPVVGHRALHAYEVAQSRDENRIEEEWGASTPEELAEEARHRTERMPPDDRDEGEAD